MILHHHHEDTAIDFSTKMEHNDHDSFHTKGHHQHKSNNEEKDSEHNHPFPLHHHISAKCNFVYARTNLQESNPLNKISILFLVSVVFQTDFFEPPHLSTNPFRDKPFLISSNYYPEANALRGPPAIV